MTKKTKTLTGYALRGRIKNENGVFNDLLCSFEKDDEPVPIISGNKEYLKSRKRELLANGYIGTIKIVKCELKIEV